MTTDTKTVKALEAAAEAYIYVHGGFRCRDMLDVLSVTHSDLMGSANVEEIEAVLRRLGRKMLGTDWERQGLVTEGLKWFAKWSKARA